ncbi:hypothetical protein SUGI_1077910 [Cryptomeria japonica]|nr:hypothetical protein SUGI_1077910 [Cryptomeria japonica]
MVEDLQSLNFLRRDIENHLPGIHAIRPSTTVKRINLCGLEDYGVTAFLQLILSVVNFLAVLGLGSRSFPQSSNGNDLSQLPLPLLVDLLPRSQEEEEKRLDFDEWGDI